LRPRVARAVNSAAKGNRDGSIPVDRRSTYNIYRSTDEPDQPKAKKAVAAETGGRGAEVIALKRPFPPAQQPDHLNDADAIRLVRMIAADSNTIVVIGHARKRAGQRLITRIQIERCVRQGLITEHPFINPRGNWQMNLTRQTAGEQITCAVAIERATRVIVITTF